MRWVIYIKIKGKKTFRPKDKGNWTTLRTKDSKHYKTYESCKTRFDFLVHTNPTIDYQIKSIKFGNSTYKIVEESIRG